jgi:hypothetical protein
VNSMRLDDGMFAFCGDQAEASISVGCEFFRVFSWYREAPRYQSHAGGAR